MVKSAYQALTCYSHIHCSKEKGSRSLKMPLTKDGTSPNLLMDNKAWFQRLTSNLKAAPLPRDLPHQWLEALLLRTIRVLPEPHTRTIPCTRTNLDSRFAKLKPSYNREFTSLHIKLHVHRLALYTSPATSSFAALIITSVAFWGYRHFICPSMLNHTLMLKT
jgi:hypothetical protein